MVVLTGVPHGNVPMWKRWVAAVAVVALQGLAKEARIKQLEAMVVPRPISRERLPPMDGFANGGAAAVGGGHAGGVGGGPPLLSGYGSLPPPPRSAGGGAERNGGSQHVLMGAAMAASMPPVPPPPPPQEEASSVDQGQGAMTADSGLMGGAGDDSGYGLTDTERQEMVEVEARAIAEAEAMGAPLPEGMEGGGEGAGEA